MSAALSSTLAVDLSHGATFAQGFPHAHFTWSRVHAPIYWHEPTMHSPQGEGFWVISRHEDAMAVITDPETFSSRQRGPATGLQDDRQAGAMMIWMDDPKHKRFRSLVNKGFHARTILALEGELRRRAVTLIKAMPEDEPFDFVSRFSRDLPLQAICLLLGVPQHERAMLAEWVDAGVAEASGEIIAREYALKLRDYGLDLIAKKRANPADNILSTIIQARLEPGEEGHEGGSLTDRELVNFFMLLFPAGAETTRSAIGDGLHALIDHPDQMKRLRTADITHLRTAIDEILRWTTPTIFKRRTAMRDVDFKGHRIREGDRPIAMRASSPIRSASTQRARRTRIFRLASAPTSVSAPAWLEWRCASPSRSCWRA